MSINPSRGPTFNPVNQGASSSIFNNDYTRTMMNDPNEFNRDPVLSRIRGMACGYAPRYSPKMIKFCNGCKILKYVQTWYRDPDDKEKDKAKGNGLVLCGACYQKVLKAHKETTS